jgi:hypothetical protein
MAKGNSGLQNETLINELSISGSTIINSKNPYGVHVFQQNRNDDGVIFGKLTKPKYNETELVKSIDTNIFELIPILPPPVDDGIPRPIYNQVTQSVIDLTVQVESLNRTVLDLRAKVQDVEIVSESLKVELDLKNLNLASTQNQSLQLTSKVTSTITELQNSIQKGTSEAVQRVSLYARNQSLQQELDALRIAASAKEQALAAGAVSTGQLASILFDKSDPTKETTPQMMAADYGGGYGSTSTAGKFAASGDPFTKTFRTWFDVIGSAELTGNKQITVDVKFTGAVNQSIWDFGFSLPVTLKANETKRFKMDTPSAYLKTLAGQHGGGLFSHSKSTDYVFTFSVVVSDGTKTENKDFTFKLFNHN